MTATLYWEDVNEGQDVPTLEKHPTTLQLARYAGASGDYSRIHFDQELARSHGFPNVVLHGHLKWAFLGQLLTDWIGLDGRIKKMRCNYRRTDVPFDTITVKGTVVRKYVEDGAYLVDVDMQVLNGKGEVTTPGSATVILPSRKVES